MGGNYRTGQAIDIWSPNSVKSLSRLPGPYRETHLVGFANYALLDA